MTQTLGKRIRELRLQEGLIQKDLAAMVGMEVTYLSKIESDRVVPGENMIRDLSKALSANVDELLLLAGKVPEDVAVALHASSKAPQFLRAARGLDDKHWDELIRMAQRLQRSEA